MDEEVRGGVAPPAPHRRHRRIKVFQPTTYLSAAGEARMHLLDISQGGAQAHSVRPPRQGQIIQIRLPHMAVAGHVAWVDGLRFGILFRTLLSDHDLTFIIDGPLGAAASAAGLR